MASKKTFEDFLKHMAEQAAKQTEQTNKHFDLLEILVLLVLWNEIGVPQRRLLSGDWWYSSELQRESSLCVDSVETGAAI